MLQTLEARSVRELHALRLCISRAQSYQNRLSKCEEQDEQTL